MFDRLNFAGKILNLFTSATALVADRKYYIGTWNALDRHTERAFTVLVYKHLRATRRERDRENNVNIYFFKAITCRPYENVSSVL